MKTVIKILLVQILTIQFANSAPFQIANRVYGNIPAAFQAEMDAIFDDVENQVNTDLPDADQSTYLKGMSNSGVMAIKGLGAKLNIEAKFRQLIEKKFKCQIEY